MFAATQKPSSLASISSLVLKTAVFPSGEWNIMFQQALICCSLAKVAQALQGAREHHETRTSIAPYRNMLEGLAGRCLSGGWLKISYRISSRLP